MDAFHRAPVRNSNLPFECKGSSTEWTENSELWNFASPLAFGTRTHTYTHTHTHTQLELRKFFTCMKWHETMGTRNLQLWVFPIFSLYPSRQACASKTAHWQAIPCSSARATRTIMLVREWKLTENEPSHDQQKLERKLFVEYWQYGQAITKPNPVVSFQKHYIWQPHDSPHSAELKLSNHLVSLQYQCCIEK